MIARLARSGHRVLGGIAAGLLLLAALHPSPNAAAEALRLTLIALPVVVLLAIARVWKQALPPGWVLLHLHLMLAGALSALAAVRLGLPMAGWVAAALLAGGVGAGWAAGRRSR